jgi:hypothetical protein
VLLYERYVELADVWHVLFPVLQYNLSAGGSLKYLNYLFAADFAPSPFQQS